MSNVDMSPTEMNIQSVVGNYNAQANNGSTAVVAMFQNALPRAIDADEVAAAEAFLAIMPLDELPKHSGLPPTHSVPWSLNRHFVGRTSELLTLANQLKRGDPTAIGHSPVITGLGGQGKTQLAVEFIFRFGKWFTGGIFWINCANPATIPLAIAACGPILYPGDAGFSLRPLPEQVALVSSAWMSPLPRLLIFDSCEDETLLDNWAPKGGGCRLLITARRASWSSARGIVAMPLGRLSRPESMALLQKHRPDLGAESPGLDAIADELGDLPLALELAGKYLARYREEEFGAPKNYLAELRSANILTHVSLAAEGLQAINHHALMTGHEAHVARTFEVSLRRLQLDNTTDNFAHNLFLRVAWLAPGEPIPRDLLKLCAEIAEDGARERYLFADAIDCLINLALIEKASLGKETVVMHRLLAAFARSQGQYAETARYSVENILANESDRYVRRNDAILLGKWEPHLTAVAIAAQQDETAAHIDLVNAAASCNTMIGNHEASRTMLSDAIKYTEMKFGPGAYRLASLLGNLGVMHSDLGELSQAEVAYKRELSIVTQAPNGPHNFEVARVYNNLGNVQLTRGDFSDAETSFDRSLRLKYRAVHPSPREIGITLSNLGCAQLGRGKLLIARKTLSKALAMKIKGFGPDHVEVAMTKVNLGVAHFKRREFTAAEICQTEALVIHEKHMGLYHYKAATILSNRGSARYELGKLREARSDYVQAMDIDRAKWGDNCSRIPALQQMVNTIDGRLSSKSKGDV